MLVAANTRAPGTGPRMRAPVRATAVIYPLLLQLNHLSTINSIFRGVPCCEERVWERSEGVEAWAQPARGPSSAARSVCSPGLGASIVCEALWSTHAASLPRSSGRGAAAARRCAAPSGAAVLLACCRRAAGENAQIRALVPLKPSNALASDACASHPTPQAVTAAPLPACGKYGPAPLQKPSLAELLGAAPAVSAAAGPGAGALASRAIYMMVRSSFACPCGSQI